MRRFDFILLDADNTLFDFDLAEHQALRSAMTAHGLPFTPETEGLYLSINRSLWAAFDRGEVEQDWLTVERFRRLNAALGGKSDPVRLNEDYLTALGRCNHLLPGALELCRELAQAGCVLAVATNGVARVQRARMEASPLTAYIPHLFISQELGARKPQTAFFDPILKQLGVIDKSRCLMVGDSLTSDILGGQNAGLPTAWYDPRGKENKTAILPTCRVADHSELKEWILL